MVIRFRRLRSSRRGRVGRLSVVEVLLLLSGIVLLLGMSSVRFVEASHPPVGPVAAGPLARNVPTPSGKAALRWTRANAPTPTPSALPRAAHCPGIDAPPPLAVSPIRLLRLL